MKFKLIAILIILVLAIPSNLQAQDAVNSLYNDNGQLKIDTTYSISKKQLKKFRKLEPILVFRLSQRLEMPIRFRRAGIDGMTLYSFKVSSEGKVVEIQAKRIKEDMHPGPTDWFVNETEILKKFFADGPNYRSLALKKGEVATYYIPVLSTLDYESAFNKVGDEYIHIQAKKERIIAVDLHCPVGIIKD